jgi:hypothetical protein
MLGKVLTVIAPKRAGLILTIFVFATLVAGSGNTTDLQLRISGTPFTMASSNKFLTARHEKPASPEARKRLFQEFLLWSAAREHR